MEFDIRMPQLTEVQTRLDELFNHVDALYRKLDDLALAAAAPGPVAQPEAPAPAKRARAPKAPPAPTPAATDANGEDHDIEDEDALRARVEFEAKRTTRQFGIGGTRAAIARVADGALRVDDVPASRLTAVLSALQAL
jgi:hypothetical protein